MTARVPANDFAAQWSEIREAALEAVDRVGRSGWLILGEEVRGFEEELAAWWGVDHAVGVASGLDAIEIALRCCGIEAGAKVLTTPLTAYATTLAIIRAGAVPVWSDVDESGGIDLELADAALGADADIRAMVPVHLYGHPLDPDALAALADRHDVVVIEDCAQSAGAHRAGRPTGRAGAAAATSLYPTKNLGAMGDGGVVMTTDEAIADRACCLRNYGQEARYDHRHLGLNSRLDELHAAVLRSALLPQLDAWLERRAAIASRYADGLAGTRLRPIVARDGASGHHLFPVEVLEGDPTGVREALRRSGIDTGRHYPTLCPDQPANGAVGEVAGDLTTARRLAEREISLPIHPQLADGDVERVLAACRDL